MRKIYLPATHFRTLVLFASFLLFAFQGEANTYYLTNAAKTSAQLPGSWNTNPAGGGTAATNFTTAGDIFIIPTGIAGTFASNTASTFASGVTLQVDGSFTVGSGANNAVTIVTINGTIIFSNTGSTQVTLPTGGNPGTSTTFTLGSSGTLKTVNANGISGTNCSLPASGGAHTTITLPTTADYEFNGTGAQATLGLPSTVNTLTINNAAGVSLSAAVTVNTLTIGSATANSILNDNGKQITSTGTLNLISGTFNIGSGATATSYPAFATNTIAAGTTVNYNSSASQTIVAVNYSDLTNTGNGPRILASSGTIGVKGAFSPGNGTYTITGSTVSFNGTTAQTIPAFNYNNLTVTNTNTNITLAGSGTIGIAGAFTPGASTFGTITGSTVSFNGSSAQSIPAFTFHNLIINNAAGISSLGGDITINQSLALTNGIVTTGSNKVIISNGGSVSRTNGWVAGNLQKYISSTTPITFEIGSSNGYRPLIINFSTITTPGNLIASATQSNGLHSAIATSGLNSSKTILRYWNLISSGLAGTYDATFGFVAADIPVGAATGSFVVRNYNSTWITSTTGTIAGTSTQATALTTFGEFSIGEPAGTPTINTQPSNATICAGSNTSFTTSSGSNPTPTVKWQRSTDGGTIWEDIIASMDGSIYTNFTTGTLIITNATVTVTGYKYRTVYTNINGSVNSKAATLTVTTLPTATITYGGSPFSSTLSTPQSVTLSGTAAYTTGIYSATPAGLTINSANGDITPSTSTVGSYTVTYTIAAAGECSPVTATTAITITLAPTADISYAGSPFCKSVSTPQSVTRTGTGNYTGGTYTSTSGLTIDPATGAITPSTSTPGIYTVTYNIPASAPFPASTTTVDIIITAVPTAAISYAGGPFCTSDETVQTVTLTGTGAYSGGTYLSSPSGLSLDATIGSFLPSASAGKSYTIAYIIPATGGCAAVPVTTTINIVSRPDASLSYPGSPFCQATASASPTLTGTSGGTYSANAGLTINSSTGVITPGTSTPGDYIVLYTIPASGPCGEVQITAPVTIVTSPTGSIDYAGQPFCTAGATKSVALSGTDLYLGGIFSASSGLIIDPVSGDITPAASTPGMYNVAYTAPNCPVTFTTSVEITAAPSATISYSGNPFCQSDGALKTVVGSSRVDLQACKLEYSIVSPK